MEFLRLWAIIWRRKWSAIGMCAFVCLAALCLALLATPVYEAKVKVLVLSSGTFSSLLSNLGVKSVSTTTVSSGSDETYDTDIALVTLQPILKQLIDSLELKDRSGEAIAIDDITESGIVTMLLPHPYVSVEQYESAAMVEITGGSTNAAQAEKIANCLAGLYLDNRRERIRAEYRQAQEYIDRELVRVKQDYESALARIRDFRVAQSAVDLHTETTALIAKLFVLRGDYEDAEKGLQEVRSRMPVTERRLKELDVYRKESEDTVQSDVLLTLRNKLNEQVVTLAQKSASLTREHPEYREVERGIEELRTLAEKQAATEFGTRREGVDPLHDQLRNSLVTDGITAEVLDAKKKLIQQYLDAYQGELLRIPGKDAAYAEFDATLSVNTEMYQALLKYRVQAGVAESVSLYDVNVVEPGVLPSKQAFPRKKWVCAIGACLGVFWGLIFAFFLEYIDLSICTSDDVRRMRGVQWLGSIQPERALRRRVPLLQAIDQSPRLVDALRAARNGLRSVPGGEGARSVVVSSLLDGDGKTMVSVGLALALAREGRKVLLCDANLRHPAVHQVFGCPNDRGLTSLLAGEATLEAAVVQTRTPGLDILPSGPVPQDPGSVLERAGFADRIRVLANSYDVVLLDTPSVLLVNDPLTIAAAADGMILVLRGGRSTFHMAEDARQRTLRARVQVLGAILNRSQDAVPGSIWYRFLSIGQTANEA